MKNINIKKITTTMMVVIGMASTSANAVFWGWGNAHSEAATQEVKADYVWDDSKSYFMNTIHESGIVDDYYSKDFSVEEFKKEYGSSLYTEDFAKEIEADSAIGSIAEKLWLFGSMGSTGLFIGGASGAPLWADNMDTYSVGKFSKAEFDTKMDVLDSMGRDESFLKYIQEHESYFIYRIKFSTTSEESYKERLSGSNSSFGKYLYNTKTFLGPHTGFDVIKQPHLIDDTTGKIYLPIKVD